MLDYQSRVEDRIRKLRQEYQEKKARSEGRMPGSATTTEAEASKLPALSTFGAQWKMRSVRYSCAGGLSVTTKQRVSSSAFADAVTERRTAASVATAGMLPSSISKKQQTEMDTLDLLDSDLKQVLPVELSFKFKKYELRAERGALGLQYVNRMSGVVWSGRNGKTTLKNSFSGRILAHDCRAGVPFEMDAPESADSDLSAFAPEPKTR
jgi:hypothetical protein